MKNVLIVEDEPKIAAILTYYLEAEGFEVNLIADGAKVCDWVYQNKPSIILLDLMLPHKNGNEICKEIRAKMDVPIIMVTAKITEIDRLIGLEIGADDYICKPFSPREVVARVKAVLRRTQATRTESDNHSGLVLDELNYIAHIDTQTLDLTPVEFKILKTLSQSPIRVWRRAQLLDHMYEDHRAVSDRTVDSHIANLRKKMQFVRPDSECIQPIYGVGYRLVDI